MFICEKKKKMLFLSYARGLKKLHPCIKIDKNRFFFTPRAFRKKIKTPRRKKVVINDFFSPRAFTAKKMKKHGA